MTSRLKNNEATSTATTHPKRLSPTNEVPQYYENKGSCCALTRPSSDQVCWSDQIQTSWRKANHVTPVTFSFCQMLCETCKCQDKLRCLTRVKP